MMICHDSMNFDRQQIVFLSCVLIDMVINYIRTQYP